MIRVEIANQQRALKLDRRRLRSAVKSVLAGEGIAEAQISLAVVDDATIRQLNARYLQHDYPTDVLSFLLERSESCLEGEVIVGAETARREAPAYGWSPADELLLYIIHGTLHLAGYEDDSPRRRAEMRAKETICLARLGVERPDSKRRGAGEY